MTLGRHPRRPELVRCPKRIPEWMIEDAEPPAEADAAPHVPFAAPGVRAVYRAWRHALVAGVVTAGLTGAWWIGLGVARGMG